MTHIASIGAGLHSSLDLHSTALSAAEIAAVLVDEDNVTTGFPSLFGNGEYTSIGNVREFPAMGTPPNIVNVPVYGQASSQQIQGQSDSPSMELQLNFVPDDWDASSTLGAMVGDGNTYCFRFALLNSAPTSLDEAGMVADNSLYYWFGKIEALQVTPSLTDANTATVTISIQSDFYGAYTSA